MMPTPAEYEIRKAIEAVQDIYKARDRKPAPRKSRRQYDRIIGVLCLGCERYLGRYELVNKLAWCYDCRKFLFPETCYPGGTIPKRFLR